MHSYISKLYRNIKRAAIEVLKFFNPFDIIKFKDDIIIDDEYRILIADPIIEDFV